MEVTKTIDRFAGEYEFLSNFYPTFGVQLRDDPGVKYQTVEHAYQAAKTESLDAREVILFAKSAAIAKGLGRKLTIRDGWDGPVGEGMKDEVMLDLLRQKFSRDPLRSLLIATGDAQICEGNWWGDTYWGVYRGLGFNRLGMLLMQVRQEIK